MSVIGVSKYAARFLPLVCGIVAIFLFARLAWRLLAPRPALIALLLFCVSDDLIYYSSELKPYSVDLVFGLAITLLAIDALEKPLTGRRALQVALLALVAPWCSFASAFVVAGCGGMLVVSSLLPARPRDAAVWCVIGLGWLASFFVAYRASAALLSPYTTMYFFWDFAFLPVWPLPMNMARLQASVGILLEIFVTPLNLTAPYWPRIGVLLPIALLAIGAVSLARRSWREWAILVAPIALAVVASAMKRYPLHGRLILELVPVFFLLIAEGTEKLRGWDRSRAKLGFTAVLILLLTYPSITAIMNSVSVRERDFNPHGDIRKNLFMT